jgi:hypothetical protein
MGWTVKESGFNSWQASRFFSSPHIQIAFGVYPASCSVGTEGFFSWNKAALV